MSTTYRPIVGKENDFKLVPPTLASEEAIHAIQVRFPQIDIDQRKAICELWKWNYEDRIPEFTHDVRIAVSSLEALLVRSEADSNEGTDKTRENLEQVISGVKGTTGQEVTALTPLEYHYELASVLFVEFTCSEEEKSQLNFKEIERARVDFFD